MKMSYLLFCLGICCLLETALCVTELEASGDAELTGVFINTESNGVEDLVGGFSFKSLFGVADKVVIPDDTLVVGACASDDVLAKVAIRVFEGTNILAEGTDFKCYRGNVIATKDAWLSDTFDDSDWSTPTIVEDESIVNIQQGLGPLASQNLGTDYICCRSVLIEPPDDNDGDDDTCPNGKQCLSCRNAPSYESCLADDVYEECPNDNFVCEWEWHTNTNGGVSQFTSKCKAKPACNARTNGPAQALCDDSSPVGLGGNQGNQGNQGGRKKRAGNGQQGNNICRECRPAICIPEICDKHCFTCHARTEAACWISGQYKPCPDDSMCFKRRFKRNDKYTPLFMGCMETSQCELANAVNVECEGDNCLSCDNDGELNPAPPKHDVSICGTPNYDICSCKGDPHCDSYDMAEVSPDGLCTHLFTKDGCDGGQQTFAVYIDIKKVGNDRRAVQRVTIETGGNTIVLSNQVGTISFSGNDVDISSYTDPPYTSGGVEISSLKSGTVVRVVLPNGIEVLYDYERTVGVNKAKDFEGSLCGICGNANGIVEDDLVYGDIGNALSVCPGASSVLAGKTEGGPINGDAVGFGWSHVSSQTADSDCNSFCS